MGSEMCIRDSLKRVTKVFWVSVSGVRVGVLFRVSVSVRDLVRLGLPNNVRPYVPMVQVLH